MTLIVLLESLQYDGKGGPPEKMQHDRRVRSAEKRLESTTTTIRGPFAFSSLPGKVDQRKAKGETASLSFGSSFGFPRIAVAGAKPAFFVFRMREKVRGKNTFSLCEIRKWRTHSILWAHRIKRKAALSWQSFRRQEILGLVGASEHNESKPKTDQGFYTKAIDEGPKNGTCKVDRAPVTYIIASHQLESGQDGDELV
ncbi:UNVERIFIED_CONTAM: 60S ribosomal protein L2, mitochondrial [Sesamum calycinum]|uniref:60S ribosomal protein L2, mitochondrial n=1 Tax=Sesamum calycinum TaxID=2727403 RepID=A0AAW2JX39_9LAMI